MRQKINIADTNVAVDIAIEIEDPVCVIPVRNWIKDELPLRDALFGQR